MAGEKGATVLTVLRSAQTASRAGLLVALLLIGARAYAQVPPVPAPGAIRVAMFNVSLNRKGAGVLIEQLRDKGHRQIDAVAEIIQLVRPDILVVNELDYDIEQAALRGFARTLTVGRGAAEGIDYGYVYADLVNTGVRPGIDLNGDGERFGPADAFGFGHFPGQYGMAVLSRLPIAFDRIRTFRKLRWRELADNRMPTRSDGTPFPSAEAQEAMRLSSKSHWDVPVLMPDGTRIHLFVSHPTPPVFDDGHDLNGRRNHDEITFWRHYIDGMRFTDDAGRDRARARAPFVVLGDLNADPKDGDGLHDGILSLLTHSKVQDPMPRSSGAVEAATKGRNRDHTGDPALDTADFHDTRGPGNLRADYVLPSMAFQVTGSGVFWPETSDPLHRLIGPKKPLSSDHRLVWVDLTLPVVAAD